MRPRTSWRVLLLLAGVGLLLGVGTGHAQETQLLKGEDTASVFTLAGTNQGKTTLTAGHVHVHGVPVRAAAPARVVVSTHTRVVVPRHSSVFVTAPARVVVPSRVSVFAPARTGVLVSTSVWTIPRTTVIVNAGWWYPGWRRWGPAGWWYPWRSGWWWPPVVVAPTYYYPWWCYPSTYSYPVPAPIILSSASYYPPNTWQPGILPPAPVFGPTPNSANPDNSGVSPGSTNDTYDYDGGPSQPVPLPQPASGASADTKNAAGVLRQTSWPTRTRPRFTYPAYGEHVPERTPLVPSTFLLAQPQPRR